MDVEREILRKPLDRAMQPADSMDVRIELVQTLALSNPEQRAEGIAISSSGSMMAIATADADTVLLYRRQASGQFDTEPCDILRGPGSRLSYPHDVSFAPGAGGELLAVAQRRGSITIYNNGVNGGFGAEPVFEISGAGSRLDFSDGVAFVPPSNDHLAVCNLALGTISFYRKRSDAPLAFDQHPRFELWQGLAEPDGLAFSASGEWLAVANHGNHSVSIFQRRNRGASGDRFRFGPAPAAVIADADFRYPHSLAFSATDHLFVTNAGANSFSVFAPTRLGDRMQWSPLPGGQQVVGGQRAFHEINAANKMEGGPKGIAIHRDTLAVCSPQHGVLLYSLSL